MQACIVVVAEGGMTIRWEDDSRTLQSSVFLSSEVHDISHV